MRLLWIVGLVACSNSKSAAKIDAPIDTVPVTACTTCDPSTQYCYQQAAGLIGGYPAIGCNAIPAACSAPATCDCLTANTTTVCANTAMCAGSGSLLTLTCVLP